MATGAVSLGATATGGVTLHSAHSLSTHSQSQDEGQHFAQLALANAADRSAAAAAAEAASQTAAVAAAPSVSATALAMLLLPAEFHSIHPLFKSKNTLLFVAKRLVRQTAVGTTGGGGGGGGGAGKAASRLGGIAPSNPHGRAPFVALPEEEEDEDDEASRADPFDPDGPRGHTREVTESVVLKLPNIFQEIQSQMQAAAAAEAAVAAAAAAADPTAVVAVPAAPLQPTCADDLMPFLMNLSHSQRAKISVFLNQYYVCEQLQRKVWHDAHEGGRHAAARRGGVGRGGVAGCSP
jgi:hypothetical protein